MEPKSEAFSPNGVWMELSGTVDHDPLIGWVLTDRTKAQLWAEQNARRVRGSILVRPPAI